MAHVIRETRVVDHNADTTEPVVSNSPMVAVARIIYVIAGIIEALLALRFILALLGANPANVFANFIYTVTRPLVAPFFGLFNYQAHYGISRFEVDTLIAMAVYALIAWILIRLFTVSTNETV